MKKEKESQVKTLKQEKESQVLEDLKKEVFKKGFQELKKEKLIKDLKQKAKKEKSVNEVNTLLWKKEQSTNRNPSDYKDLMKKEKRRIKDLLIKSAHI